MNYESMSTLDRASAVLCDLLQRRTGCRRRDLIDYVCVVAKCHRTTVERALTLALEDGFVITSGRIGASVYKWNDDFDAADPEPQCIKRVPVEMAPRVTGKSCSNGIEWSFFRLAEMGA